MKLSINGNEAKILMISKRGSIIQNTSTIESDEDFYVVFCYTSPNCSLNEYPTDIQKEAKLYKDLQAQLSNQGLELNGDVVFKEIRALLASKTSSGTYDYFFTPKEFVINASCEWEWVDALKSLMYNHNEILNHLWRKVGSLYESLSNHPTNVSRFMYYARIYEQTFITGKYTPWLENEEYASDIRNVKLGGSPMFSLSDYKYKVEKLHLTVPLVKSDEVLEIKNLKSEILGVIQQHCIGNLEQMSIKLPIKSSMIYSCSYDFTYEYLDIRFSTHPQNYYSFRGLRLKDLKLAVEAKSFGRHFKVNIENKFTVYKNGELLTERG